jgi:hypothetical protein
MEVLILFIIVAVGLGAKRMWEVRQLGAEDTDSALLTEGDDALQPRNPKFVALCDEIARGGGMTRTQGSEGWYVQNLQRDLSGGGSLRVRLHHSTDRRLINNALEVSVHDVVPQALHIQSAYSQPDDSGQRTRRRFVVDIATGDPAFDDGFIIHRDCGVTFATLTHEARAALLNLAQRADVKVAGGTLTTSRQLSPHALPPAVIDWSDAVAAAGATLATRDPEAAWAQALRTDPVPTVRRRLLTFLSSLPSLPAAVEEAAWALHEDPATDAVTRVEAAKCGGAQGREVLTQLALDTAQPVAVRSDALAFVVSRLSKERLQAALAALAAAWATTSVAAPEDEPLALAYARALTECPTQGTLPALMKLLAGGYGADTAQALLAAVAAQPEPDEEVEAALLPALSAQADATSRVALQCVIRRGSTASILALKAHIRRPDLNPTERDRIIDAVEIIQARIGEGEGAGGALSLVEAGAAGGLALLDAGDAGDAGGARDAGAQTQDKR